MQRGLGGRIPPVVLKYIDGVEYPATKEDIIERAEQRSAPSEIIRLLDDLPDFDYDNMEQVKMSLSQLLV